MLSLSEAGKKSELITRIMRFVQTGEITQLPTIPAQSRAKNYPQQSLTLSGLMLYGGYKNDARTRAFFKKLIGDHFHFTAFGIDWLNDRWLQGNPPTYQEFAAYWVQEMKVNAREARTPKKEWAYINFLQRMQREKPEALKNELMRDWKKLQASQAARGYAILSQCINVMK